MAIKGASEEFVEAIVAGLGGHPHLSRGAAAEIHRRAVAAKVHRDPAEFMRRVVHLLTESDESAAFVRPAGRQAFEDDPFAFVVGLLRGVVASPDSLAEDFRLRFGAMPAGYAAERLVTVLRDDRSLYGYLTASSQPEPPGRERRAFDVLLEAKQRGWIDRSVDVAKLASEPGYAALGDMDRWEAFRVLRGRLFGVNGGPAAYGDIAGPVEPAENDELCRRPTGSAANSTVDEDIASMHGASMF